jgi:hypothetical protein
MVSYVPAPRPRPSNTAGSKAKTAADVCLVVDPLRDAVQVKKTQAELKTLPKDLANAQKKQADAKKELDKQATLRGAAFAALSADPTNATKKAAFDTVNLAYQNAQRSFTKYSNEVTALQGKITTAKQWLDQTNTKYAVSTGNNGSGSTASTAVTNAANFARAEYTYNIPLIKSAHFGGGGKEGLSLALQDTAGKQLMPSKVSDGLAAFNNLGNSKGIIQISSETAYYLAKEQGKKGYKGKKSKPYGFKFHYNPNSIGMSYGTMTDMSPELLMSGRDKVNPIVPTGTGGFGFELMLNRLEDLNYINPDGTLKPNKPEEKVDQITRSRELYGTAITESTFKEIWQKGTMYDLDFLFRALHGGQGDYMSSLRGKTSDQGWLNGAAVEFHLGSNLRYLGRITNIDITHGVFNSRMVPLISYVKITAARFYDLKTTQDPRTVPGTSVSGVRGGGGGFRNAVME